MKTYFNKNTGYLQQVYNGCINGVHRITMEKFLKRKLNKNEIVHHINGNKTDNRLENLEVMSSRDHMLKHIPREKHFVQLICQNCGKLFLREIGKHKYNTKHNQKYFCSRKCIGLFNFIAKANSEKVSQSSPKRLF